MSPARRTIRESDRSCAVAAPGRGRNGGENSSAFCPRARGARGRPRPGAAAAVRQVQKTEPTGARTSCNGAPSMPRPAEYRAIRSPWLGRSGAYGPSGRRARASLPSRTAPEGKRSGETPKAAPVGASPRRMRCRSASTGRSDARCAWALEQCGARSGERPLWIRAARPRLRSRCDDVYTTTTASWRRPPAGRRLAKCHPFGSHLRPSCHVGDRREEQAVR